MIIESTASSAVKPTRRYQILAGLLISIVSLVLCLGAIELSGYIWERKTAQGPLGWTLVASRRLNLERHGSVNQSYTLFQPNDDYLWEGIPVQINSHGFRTDEYLNPKPVGTYRVLNLGDSVTFGWEVHQEDTYGEQLESMLNEREDGRNYEVINAGIPAWTLESERNFLLQEGLDYQPDIVILGITVANDIYDSVLSKSMGATRQGSLFQCLRDHTYSWPFLTTQARFLLSNRQGPEAIPVLNPYREAIAYFPLEEDSQVWEKLWSLILEMQQASQEHGADFALIVFPTALQLNSAAHPDVPQRVLKERAKQAGIPLIDLLPIYRQKCESAEPDACEGYENLLFADVWMHPNKLGHQVAAQALMQSGVWNTSPQ
jgi:GDSL-like Lipase/Acylhydrolase family